MFSSFPWNSLLLLSCVLLFYQKGAHCSSVRQKRNLYQLFQMVLKDTDKDPLDFIDYGCYCGLGGSGQPVDDIDRCCQQHDLCYDGVAKKCTNPKIETYKWSPGNPIHCNNEEGTCEYRTCMCDRALNECFNKYTAHPETANKNKRC